MRTNSFHKLEKQRLAQVAAGWRLAFTRLELLAVLAVLALLGTVVLPVIAAPSSRNARIQCLNNLRRIGQAFQSWSNEHGDRFPWRVPQAEGGAAYYASDPLDYFRPVSNELVTPKVLVCPNDGARSVPSGWDSWFMSGMNNLSYFAGLHGDLNESRSWLAGDRNLTGLSEGCRLGGVSSIRISNNSVALWDLTLHVQARNILLSDGSTVPCSNFNVTNYIQAALARDPEGALHVSRP